MSHKTIISILIFAAIGLAIWTTLFYHSKSSQPLPTVALPDAFMEDVSAVMMDKQGKPSMKLSTPKMIHYTENDTTEITSPELTFYRKSPEPWYINSKYAIATQGIDQLIFSQDVVIHHSADISNPATIIKTPSLTVYPNKQVAETIEHITLIQPNLVIQSKGMHADMQSGQIKLLSEARGEYVPSS